MEFNKRNNKILPCGQIFSVSANTFFLLVKGFFGVLLFNPRAEKQKRGGKGPVGMQESVGKSTVDSETSQERLALDLRKWLDCYEQSTANGVWRDKRLAKGEVPCSAARPP